MLDALRKQLAQNLERLRKAGRLAGRAPAAGAGAARAEETFDASLRRRVAAIDPRAPDGRAKALRAFVEAALVAEFGAALLTDPGFGGLLDEVSASFAEDPELAARLAAALAAL